MTDTSLRPSQARVGVFAAFFLAGFMAAVWVVYIPAIQAQTHATKGDLGLDLLVFGLGSVVAMQFGGRLIDRVGSRLIVTLGAIVLALAIPLPGLATSSIWLGLALFVMGLGNGALDLAMNDQGVRVQRAYGRPIMSAFHALYSVGGAAGALLGGLAQLAGIGPEEAFLIAGAFGLAATVFVVPRMLPGTTSADSAPVGSSPSIEDARTLRRRVVILASLACALMLAEGVANDWSALHAIDVLHQSRAAASIAFGVFAAFMTAGRFSADRISHRLGSVAVVRFGSALAAIGMAVVILSPTYPLTLAGWALFGAGLSGVAPQIFSAAGNIGSTGRGVALSRVVSSAYAGQLIGPAIIGWIASGIGLSLAFVLPLLLLVLGVVFAGNLRPRTGSVTQ
jgi:MFS family permease